MSRLDSPTVWVVEGADGTGKSTFAERVRFSMTHAVRIVHNGPAKELSPTDLYETYLNQLNEAIHHRDVEGLSTVIDRSFLGEIIYGYYRAAGPRLTRDQVHHLERFCHRNGIVMIGLEAEYAVRKQRHLDRGEPWTALLVYTGADYFHYFRSRVGRKFWITADTSAPHQQ